MESEDVLIIDENNYSFDEIKLKKKVNVNSNNIQNNIETKKNKKSNIFLSKVDYQNIVKKYLELKKNLRSQVKEKKITEVYLLVKIGSKVLKNMNSMKKFL